MGGTAQESADYTDAGIVINKVLNNHSNLLNVLHWTFRAQNKNIIITNHVTRTKTLKGSSAREMCDKKIKRFSFLVEE